MSTTQSPGTCIAFRTPQPEQFSTAASRHVSAEDSLSPVVMDPENPGMLNRFGEQFRLTGIEISLEEVFELKVFDEFLARHVQPNGVFNVQCMLLWNEWVRTFRHRTHGFPKLIREKEFRSVITDKFGVEITHDGFRGSVYPGIRFVR